MHYSSQSSPTGTLKPESEPLKSSPSQHQNLSSWRSFPNSDNRRDLLLISGLQCLGAGLASMFLSPPRPSPPPITTTTLKENSYIVKGFCFILSLKYQSHGMYIVFLTGRPFIPGYNRKDLKFHCLHGWKLFHWTTVLKKYLCILVFISSAEQITLSACGEVGGYCSWNYERAKHNNANEKLEVSFIR